MWEYVTIGTFLLVLELLVLVPLFVLACLNKHPPGAKYSGKHVMICGGSQGIGLELAKQCANEGSDITIVARNIRQLELAREEVSKCLKYPDSQRIQILSCDVAKSYDGVEEMVKQAVEKFGEVDVLLNCAGFAKCKYFDELPIEDLQNLMNVNYFGSLYPTRAVVSSMKRRCTGTIAFVSSQGGQTGFVGMSGYSPTKFAIKGLAESLRSELLPYDINIAVVYPPDTDTPGYAREQQDKSKLSDCCFGLGQSMVRTPWGWVLSNRAPTTTGEDKLIESLEPMGTTALVATLANTNDIMPGVRSLVVECQEISETAGLIKPDVVAKKILTELETGTFSIHVGVDGLMLDTVTSGLTEYPGLYRAVLQIHLIGLFRLIAMCYATYFQKIVVKHSKAKRR